ncbi:MAG: hypothetical protein HZC28_14585 [Spirochaetes bacterium]|nr:hypothetical protein [Spirochaetota bacterium]
MILSNTMKSIALVILISTAAFSLEVAVDEIQNAAQAKIEFINYTGPNKKIDPAGGISAIGEQLANGSRAKFNETFRYFGKYSITRAVTAEEPGKLSADIFSIDADAQVDHIDNVRRIIAAYLSAMYGYEKKQAWALAVYVSYYNAVHRAETTYFAGAYKASVMKYINASNAGIAITYSEWPGKTKMLIPLTDGIRKGASNVVDPFTLSDDKTKKELRKDDRIPERKEITEMKEKALDKEKGALTKDKEDVAKKKDDVAKEKLALDTKKDATPKEKEAVAKKEEEVKKEEKRVEEKAADIKKKEDTVAEEKKEIAQDEKKKAEAVSPKEAALDAREKTLDKREDALKSNEPDKNIYAQKLYYFKMRDYIEGGHYNNDLYMIDAAARKLLFKSSVLNICGDRCDIFSDGIVVLTHTGTHGKAHHLTLIDRETLTEKDTGADDIFYRSFIEIKDSFIYALVVKDGKHYLGKFDSTLTRVALSADAVNENTFISFFSDQVFINAPDKSVLVLNMKDLSRIDVIAPETGQLKK